MTPEQQANSIRHQKEEHITPEEIGTMAASAGVKTVVLTHLPATADPKDKYQRFGGNLSYCFTGAWDLSGGSWLTNPEHRRCRQTRDSHRGRAQSRLDGRSEPRFEASQTGVCRDPRLHFEPAAHRRRRRDGISPQHTSRVFDQATRLTGAEGPIRGDPQPGGGSEGPGRTACLYQRVCRGGQGLGLSAASNRPCWSARSPGGPPGDPTAQ